MKLRVGLGAFITAVLLVATSIPTANAIKNPEDGTNCSSTVKKNALATVRGQSQAIAKQDFKTARSYSAASFRAGVSVKDFTNIITQGYAFLGDAKTFAIVECKTEGKSVSLAVEIIDRANATYYVFYLLAVQSKKELVAPNKTGYGIVAAQLAESTTPDA
jgi:hypothetical protein